MAPMVLQDRRHRDSRSRASCGCLTCCQSENLPLLNMEAAEPDWQQIFPVWSLPPLPARHYKYYVEPFVGSSVVGVICAVLVGLTCSAASPSAHTGRAASFAWLAVSSIWLQAIVAALCVLHLLFGNKGEIERHPATCYPIPDPVCQSLMNPDALPMQRNVDGLNGNSYCVRCFVWRPGHKLQGGPGHHCNTCQRCVVGFDHHCGVFGRCITEANMVPFYTLIIMLFSGMLTAGLTLTAVAWPSAFAAFGASDAGLPHQAVWRRHF